MRGCVSYRLIRCTGFLFLPAWVLGQTAPRPETQIPVIRASTHLVQVNVIVTDKKGKAVGDLKREDFTLLDAGRRQTISLYSLEVSPPDSAPSLPLPPNTFTNRPEYRGASPNVVVILIDGLNTQFSDQAYARQQVAKFLSQLRPQDRVALYALGKRLRVIQEFTSDSEALLEALARLGGNISSELAASEPRSDQPDVPRPAGPRAPRGLAGNQTLTELNSLFDDRAQAEADYFIVRRADITLEALEAIANHLAQIPGRKTLIWVSGSFPYWIGLDSKGPLLGPRRGLQTFSQEIERATRVLNSGNLAIYPVDARGLMQEHLYSAQNRRIDMTNFNRPLTGIETMQELAELTGGRAIYNTNDIQGAVRSAIDDSRVTYVLGFYPSHNKWDGKFHKISVEIQRPGVHTLHRRGYFALPEQAPASTPELEEMDKLVWSPLDATRIRLLVHTNMASGEILRVALEIDPHDIKLVSKDGRWSGALKIYLIELDPTGKNLKGSSDTLNLALRSANYLKIIGGGLKMSKDMEIVPGASQLRIVVSDQPSGAVGSVSVPLRRSVADNP